MSGSQSKAGKGKKGACSKDHSFFPTYKTIDNSGLNLDEPLNIGLGNTTERVKILRDK